MIYRILSLLLIAFFLPGCEKDPGNPNILLIVVDDMGWSDLGCYGNDFHETPHIDRLSETGVRFTNGYATCPVCSPTRASIMTGKYPANVNITDWIPGRQHYMGLEKDKKLQVPEFSHELELEEKTLAEKLRENGYRTYHVGKWHLGGDGYLPENQGFDVNIAGNRFGSPPDYFYPYGDPERRQVPGLQEKGMEGEYLTDRLTEEAIQFIREKKENPFFIYLPFYTVHIPIQGKPEKVRKYTDKLSGEDYRWTNPDYAAMVESLDENIGRLIDALDDEGISGQTFILLTSDNGGLSVFEGNHTPATVNHPFRAGKGYLYEGGIREPYIIYYPGLTSPGRIYDEVITSADIFPTIMDLTGIPFQEVDGRSFLPVLQGEKMEERPVFWHYPHYSNQGGHPGAAVRKGHLKLIRFFEEDRIELYDLSSDPGETINLKDSLRDEADDLLRMLNAWLVETNASLPIANPAYQPNDPQK